MSVEKIIQDKLFVTNEYGYAHAKATPDTLSPGEVSYLTQYGAKDYYVGPNGEKLPLHSMCINCQARHILAHKDSPDIKNSNVFKVKCKGMPKNMPASTASVIKKMSTEQGISEHRAKNMLYSAIDPVAWAELYLGFTDKPDENGDPSSRFLRWYQKEILRCNSNRIALRWGRRSGKTFTLSIKLLYHIFNSLVDKGVNSDGIRVKKGPNIIIITPFQAQLKMIFDEIQELIKKSSDLESEVTTSHNDSLYTKTPHFRMQFRNGAVMNGFVTGAEIRQDGSSGGAIRGQNADIIYIDEMDMISPSVMEKVIQPLLLTTANTRLYVSSTPIGKAGKFYDLCMNRPDFKHFYLPSTVLPHWDEVKHEIEFDGPEDEAFISEYMAQFIESSSGVFKSIYVYEAMYDYEYVDSDIENAMWWIKYAKVRSRSDMITCIGIDWNKNAGSEFVVIKYDPRSQIYWIVDAVNVSPSQFNSIRFIEEVKRLNFKWKPDYIYADEGYGHHIIDDLLYEAHQLHINKNGGTTPLEQQIAKLKTRLKKFNFSQKVELIDPVTSIPFERTGKEFLVENAVRAFEHKRIRFPSSDMVIRNQLLNYIVLRRHASNGRPVYGMRNPKTGDHRLDALMLALGGLFLETDSLYSPNARKPKSLPGLVSKDTLEARVAKSQDEIPSIPGYDMQMFKLVSNKMDPDEDKFKHKKVSTQALPTGRGDFPQVQATKSLLERLQQKMGISTFATRNKEHKVSNAARILRAGNRTRRSFME